MKNYISNKIVNYIICLLVLAFAAATSVYGAEYQAGGEVTVWVNEVIATQDHQKMQNVLNEFREKLEPCNLQNPSPQCEQILQAIDLLESALNQN